MVAAAVSVMPADARAPAPDRAPATTARTTSYRRPSLESDAPAPGSGSGSANVVPVVATAVTIAKRNEHESLESEHYVLPT